MHFIPIIQLPGIAIFLLLQPLNVLTLIGKFILSYVVEKLFLKIKDC